MQWWRAIVLAVAAPAAWLVTEPSSPCEWFWFSLLVLGLISVACNATMMAWPRPLYAGAVALGLLLFNGALGGELARQLGGRIEAREVVQRTLFMASVGVGFWLWRSVLMQGFCLAPASRKRLQARGGGNLRGGVTALALFLCAPILITTFNIHRFKIANATNPRAACNLDYQTVSFRSEDGLRLSGWFIPRQGSAAAVLLVHGIGANGGNFLGFVPFLHRAGFNVFVFDQRGHGDSAGHTISFGLHEARDVRAAMAYLRSRRDARGQRAIKRVAALAFSMGASSLLHAMPGLPDVRGVVADSTFADFSTLAERQINWLPPAMSRAVLWVSGVWARLELGVPLSDISPRRHIAVIAPRPLLLIHGTGDMLIPPSQARLNFAAARPPKELWMVPGAGHIGAMGVAGPQYERRVAGFLRRCLQ